MGFWVFYLINGFTGTIVLNMLQLLKLFKDNDNKNSEYLLAVYPAVYLFGLIMMTYLNFNRL